MDGSDNPIPSHPIPSHPLHPITQALDDGRRQRVLEPALSCTTGLVYICACIARPAPLSQGAASHHHQQQQQHYYTGMVYYVSTW
ncbi:hypothetical protein LY76DRAFT_586759 [Colletotrichum caudatum]|nr:hypothetical protein LY76DRAFT_586759 [Colletotrichum caudatum]